MRVIIAAALSALSLVSTVAAATAAKPELRLAARAPLVVRGLNFKPRERITLTVIYRGKRVRHLNAGASGSFVARFGDVTVTRCGAPIVQAAGNRGSSAVLKRVPLPGCLPARAPG